MNLKNLLKPRVENTLLRELAKVVDGIHYRDGRVIYVEEPDDSQSHVDLSVKNNPYEPEILHIDCNGSTYDVNVYSIFHRYKEGDDDANPLIYALKNERGWQISKKDRGIIYEHLRAIVQKIVSAIPHDVTLIMPSSNKLNTYFSKEIEKVVKGMNVCTTDIIEKRSTYEILEELRSPRSDFFKYYHKYGEDAYNDALEEFKRYMKDMNKNHSGKFTYHCVKNSEMRNLITNSMKAVDDEFQEATQLLNDKNIIILDDSISRGQTIIDAVKVIGELYLPKSITIITLFSKSYDK